MKWHRLALPVGELGSIVVEKQAHVGQDVILGSVVGNKDSNIGRKFIVYNTVVSLSCELWQAPM